MKTIQNKFKRILVFGEMSKNKQSSIEWLISQLQKSKDWHRVLNEISQMSSAMVDIIEQAKAMHKEEIIQSWENGDGEFDNIAKQMSLEYYNETFGGNK